MSNLLILYGFNTYFNRTIKKFSTYNEYKSLGDDQVYLELSNVNFDISDGVYAKHTINATKLDPAYNKNPNYVVAEDADGNLSRWFVLEAVKQRGGQFVLSLKRDVIADFSDLIKTAPAYIQKGSLSYESPLLFNNEGMQFNQIKKKEILLKDSSQTPWIVGYMARNFSATGTDKITTHAKVPTGFIYDYDDLPEIIKNNLSAEVIVPDKDGIEISITSWNKTYIGNHPRYNRFRSTFYLKNDNITSSISDYNETNDRKFFGVTYPSAKENVTQIIKDNINPSNFYLKLASKLGLNSLNENFYNSFNNVVYKDNNDVLHTIRFKKVDEINCDYSLNQSNILSDPIGLAFNQLGIDCEGSYPQNVNIDYNPTGNDIVTLKANITKYVMISEVGVYQDGNLDISSSRNECADVPYDIFAIPAAEIIKLKVDNDVIEVAGNSALQIARSIKLKGESNIYDIQLLPYCPFRECLDITDNTIIDTTFLTEHQDYEFVKDEDDNIINIVVFPITSKGTFDIELNDDYLKIAENVIERKIASETVKARFVSPNYSGSFDVNPQKNNGIDTVNVDYNLKPISPYIHVAPVFKGLYGDDFNDARGLICGGDFSISLANDAWEQYQVQNKNYENIFNRQIENLDVNNSIAMEKAKYTAIIGTLTGGISSGVGGAVAGAEIGGPWGAAAGAAVGLTMGGAMSAIGAMKDIELLGKQQSENRDYAVDMYTYNLQNIQALPYTLSKVSAINENNKIYPFIEIYDCTDIEKQNLRDKIKYNGMTVMVQGKIEDYVVNEGDYIQAQLIRIDDFDDDSHVLVEIYNELMKGVYIYGW